MKIRKILAALLCAVMLLGLLPVSASASNTFEAGGVYQLSGSLSCYVNAMGGIDFASGMLSGISVTVDNSGNAYMTINLGVNNGNIYSVNYIAFVDASYVAPGYYDESGVLHRNTTYTTSSNTATNSSGNAVHYVDSITFPVSTSNLKSTYYLYIYVESNVMGVQFCNGSGSGSSGQPGVLTPYVAQLSVDWGSMSAGAVKVGERTAAVSYTKEKTSYNEGEYLLQIPAVLSVDAADGTSVYQVIMLESELSENSGINVTVPDDEELTDGSEIINAKLKLSDNVLSDAGGILTGVVILPDETVDGTWVGRTQFTVNLIAIKE